MAAYDPDTLWQTESGNWSIGLAYEAASMPVMPGATVVRVVIRGAACFPVDAVIDTSGRVTFGDSIRTIPQYVRDQAVHFLRGRYDRLRAYSTGAPIPGRTRAPKTESAKSGSKPKRSAAAKPVTRTVTKVVVGPPRDAQGRFLPWSTASGTKKGTKASETKSKANTKTQTKGGSR